MFSCDIKFEDLDSDNDVMIGQYHYKVDSVDLLPRGSIEFIDIIPLLKIKCYERISYLVTLPRPSFIYYEKKKNRIFASAGLIINNAYRPRLEQHIDEAMREWINI